MRGAQGFTPTELVIALVILGILTAASESAPRCAAAATDAWGSATSPEGFYGLSFAAAPTATTYTLQATAIGNQAQDTGCSTMTLTEAGVKMPVACWR